LSLSPHPGKMSAIAAPQECGGRCCARHFSVRRFAFGTRPAALDSGRQADGL
jgi:hypothetical protein